MTAYKRVSVNGEPEGHEFFKGFNFNTFIRKKTVAKGLFNFGLLMSNASQLKAVITVGPGETFFYPSIVLIALSIVLQLIAAVLICMMGKHIGNTLDEWEKTSRLNDVTLALAAVITVINVFTSAFGVKLSSK